MQPFHIPLPGYALNSVCHGEVLLPALPALTKPALLPALPALETSLACTHKAALPRTHKGPGTGEGGALVVDLVTDTSSTPNPEHGGIEQYDSSYLCVIHFNHRIDFDGF